MARVLRGTLRYGRDQQLLLSVTGSVDLRCLARTRAARVRLRRQGEPLPDSHEEAERSGGSSRPVLLACTRTSQRAGAGAVSTPAAMAGQRRALQGVSQRAAAQPQARRRVPGTELVYG